MTTPGVGATTYKHLQVREYLERLIDEGLKVGDAIPSERFLTQTFGISRMTVRQAIDGLVAEGILRREHGRGTFVAPPGQEFELRLTTFGEEMRHRGLVPGTRVLTAELVAASPRLAATLGIEPGSSVHHLERLRTADGEPLIVEENWIPAALVGGLLDDRALLEDGTTVSLYDVLRTAGLPPTWGEDTIAAGLASDREAGLLEVAQPHAVLRTRRLTYSDNTPVEVSQTCTRGDRYTLLVPLREPHQTIVPRAAAADAPAH